MKHLDYIGMCITPQEPKHSANFLGWESLSKWYLGIDSIT